MSWIYILFFLHFILSFNISFSCLFAFRWVVGMFSFHLFFPFPLSFPPFPFLWCVLCVVRCGSAWGVLCMPVWVCVLMCVFLRSIFFFLVPFPVLFFSFPFVFSFSFPLSLPFSRPYFFLLICNSVSYH